MSDLEINIKKGAVFSGSVSVYDNMNEPLDLTNKTITAQLREFAESANATDFQITVSGNTVIYSLLSTQTEALTYKTGVWDIRMADNTDATNITYILSGTANIYSDVTRPERKYVGTWYKILSCASRTDFPEQGQADILYLDMDANKLYRYADDSYVVISKGDTGEVSKAELQTALDTKAPAYTYGTTDIGEGAELTAGTLYFYYEEPTTE